MKTLRDYMYNTEGHCAHAQIYTHTLQYQSTSWRGQRSCGDQTIWRAKEGHPPFSCSFYRSLSPPLPLAEMAQCQSHPIPP